LLGSSALLLQAGLTESLAGRFLLHRFSHWDFPETKEAFRFGFDQWIAFGGYPGAAQLLPDETLWRGYILDSLIETTLSRDILQLQKISKPALLRALFFLAVRLPAQIVSYNKLCGMLVETGHISTVAHYLDLLGSAFLIRGLPKFPVPAAKGSPPKIIVLNNALVSACAGRSFSEMRSDTSWWGRLVENAVGAHLLSTLHPAVFSVSYFRDRMRGKDLEVDFVVRGPLGMSAIEVTHMKTHSRAGLDHFVRRYPDAKTISIGPGGVSFEKFFSSPAERFL
jgi:predicted AAA+ superfamily ATPase